MTSLDLVLTACGLLAVGGAALAMTSRVLHHVLVMTVLSALGQAGCLVVLGAPTVGGIALLLALLGAAALLLVGLGVTRSPLTRHDDYDVSWTRRAGAGALGLLVSVLLGLALWQALGWETTVRPDDRTAALGIDLIARHGLAVGLLALLSTVLLSGALHLLRTEEQR